MKRRLIAFLVASALMVATAVPAFAQKPDFEEYCNDNPDRCEVGKGFPR